MNHNIIIIIIFRVCHCIAKHSANMSSTVCSITLLIVGKEESRAGLPHKTTVVNLVLPVFAGDTMVT